MTTERNGARSRRAALRFGVVLAAARIAIEDIASLFRRQAEVVVGTRRASGLPGSRGRRNGVAPNDLRWKVGVSVACGGCAGEIHRRELASRVVPALSQDVGRRHADCVRRLGEQHRRRTGIGACEIVVCFALRHVQDGRRVVSHLADAGACRCLNRIQRLIEDLRRNDQTRRRHGHGVRCLLEIVVE